MKVKVSRWKEHRKGFLLGFADIEMEGGYILRGVTVHRKEDSRWCNPPAKEFIKEDGSQGWSRVFDFVDKETYYQWSDSVLEALKDFHGRGEATGTDDEVPW